MKKGVKIFGLLAGLGALAFWRYKKATPEEKQTFSRYIKNSSPISSKTKESSHAFFA